MQYKQHKVLKCIAKCNDLQSLSDAMQVEHLVTLRCYTGKRVNSPLYMADISQFCSYALFLSNKARINSICILYIINQTQDEAININDNCLAIPTLQDDQKLCITCLQFSYTIKLHFPCDIIYLPDGCEVKATSFLLQSNNKLHVESSIETPQHKLGFNRSYSKIDNFNLMQSLNLTSLIDNKLQDLAHKILEMKQMSIYSINSTLTKLTAYQYNFWSSVKWNCFQPWVLKK